LFAHEGAAVVVNDIAEDAGRETVRMIECDGGVALYDGSDIRFTDGVRAVVARTDERFGRLDALVSLANAGESRSVADFDRSGAELGYAVNVLALVEGARFAAPVMERNGGGSIVAVSSIQAVCGTGRSPDYAAAKAAILGATRSMAVELWQRRIRVNALTPTAVTGPAWRVVDELGWDALPEFERRFGSVLRHLPGGVAVDPMGVAYAALFLVSDESSWITGITLPVDAGMHMFHYGVFNGVGECATPKRVARFRRNSNGVSRSGSSRKKGAITPTRLPEDWAGILWSGYYSPGYGNI
jgi:NAD(P)-dependent dehydrogenase (short-subunit alcohol dehydrogenase family)